MSTPLTKRRRLKEANQKLSRPFKSPFKTSAGNNEKDVHAAVGATTRESQNSRGAGPAVIIGQQMNRALESQIRAMREDTEVLEQALKILKSGRDPELDQLTVKWRSVSRIAAEELFAGAKDKVDRMGGVASWRQMEHQQMEWRNQWDRDPAHNAGTDEGDFSIEHHRDEDIEESAMPPMSKEDDAFTMDMMLRSLHVNLEVIGYDKQEQQWVN